MLGLVATSAASQSANQSQMYLDKDYGFSSASKKAVIYSFVFHIVSPNSWFWSGSKVDIPFHRGLSRGARSLS